MPTQVQQAMMDELRKMANDWVCHRFGHGPHDHYRILAALVDAGALKAETAHVQADELREGINSYPTLSIWTHDGYIMSWGQDDSDPLRHLIAY